MTVRIQLLLMFFRMSADLYKDFLGIKEKDRSADAFYVDKKMRRKMLKAGIGEEEINRFFKELNETGQAEFPAGFDPGQKIKDNPDVIERKKV